MLTFAALYNKDIARLALQRVNMYFTRVSLFILSLIALLALAATLAELTLDAKLKLKKVI